MNKYSNVRVYYSSGTGNSKMVADWIYNIATSRGIKCVNINIPNLNYKELEPHKKGELIIITSPVHGFNYPPIVLNFLFRMPIGRNHIMLMNTRAGMIIGKHVTPGLSGITFLFASCLLMFKGYKIVSMYPIDLPSNWISIHPGLNRKSIFKIFKIVKPKVISVINNLLSGKRNYKGMKEIIQDIIISPIAILYFISGRFIFAKTYYASSDCNRCNICIDNCPVKAIKIIDNRPYWTYSCESCMKCMSNCPKKCIETAHGSIILFTILISSLVMNIIYSIFPNSDEITKNGLLKFIFDTIVFLSLYFIWYLILHYLMRYKWFEKIVKFTSLTKYKWWGKRYKAIKESNQINE